MHSKLSVPDCGAHCGPDRADNPGTVEGVELKPRSLAVRQTRLAVRRALQRVTNPGTAIVALSGGADSLALAAAAAVEGPRLGWRVGAVIVDHGLQSASADVAARAATQATTLGLRPVHTVRVAVEDRAGAGPEAAARSARYEALQRVAAASASETESVVVLTGHTRDDQAEQVLLGLARGSGLRTIAGIPPLRALGGTAGALGDAADGPGGAHGRAEWREGPVLLRPFLEPDPEVFRHTTRQACTDEGLTVWDDPHNRDHRYARVRVRERVLPVLRAELGDAVTAALARSADLARADAEALDALTAAELAAALVAAPGGEDKVGALIARLRVLPAALRTRVIRGLVARSTPATLSRDHTDAIDALITDWRGQGPVFVPGARVERVQDRLQITRQVGSPRRTSTTPPDALQ